MANYQYMMSADDVARELNYSSKEIIDIYSDQGVIVSQMFQISCILSFLPSVIFKMQI